MGGDDLESDDDYLKTGVAQDDDNASENDDMEQQPLDGSKKRSNEVGNDEIATKQKKAKAKNKAISKIDHTNPLGKRKLLLHAARGIGQEPLDVQAAFLYTCYTHALGGTKSAGEKITPLSFTSWRKDGQLKKDSAWTNDERDAKYPFIIKECIQNISSSMKKLKDWNVKKSPMILIICVSARRCVAVLKAISSLKIQCAKLFAKHMDVQNQIAQLLSTPFPIAVGTPCRITKLCHDGALTLQSTELLWIDGHEDGKAFTVCSSNDTAPELAKFIHEQVQPQISTRPNKIKFVMS